MIRFIGMGILFCTGVYAGYVASAALKQQILLSESLLALVRNIENKIRYFNQPLPDIYRDFNDPLLTETGFMEALSGGWEAALGKIDVPEQVKGVMLDFSRRLGRGVGEEQEGNCRLCASSLEEHIRIMREEYPNRRKVYCSLGACAGLMAVILLL
ncbi:MAG: stage III sporulation protein AB [Oscillospiraceae bacterium]|nr:stage III sporulation protein AB [Oscillospiraceae bacterium]